VAANSVGPSTCLARLVSERNERFAALVRSERGGIVTSYARTLNELPSPDTVSPRFHELAVTKAWEVLSDVAESVLAGEVRACRGTPAGWTIDQFGTEEYLSPAEWLRAAEAFSHLTVAALASHVEDDHDLLPCFTVAVLALNESINRRAGEAIAAYTAFLLDRVHQAQAEERCRIARDLHDRLGERLSMGLRQLDLQEIAGSDPLSQAGIARTVLTDAMVRLRLVNSDLRDAPVTSLAKAIVRYLDSAPHGAEVRLRVSGDETWAGPAVLDETFLIAREAIRNALAHGAPRLVRIDVDVAPHELRMSVEDDGRGFVPVKNTESRFAGTGLASMRERATAVGGRLTVSSAPGSGTSVQLIVPLPGHHDE